MKLVAFFIVISTVLSIAYCAHYSNCGSESGTFTKISVSDCGEKEARCILKRGTNATITIEFTSNNDVENEVTAICHGKVGGMFVPFKLPNQNACVDSGLECPLEKGKVYKYEASFPVLKIYPKLDVEVKYELKNSKKVDIICVLIPVKIV